MEVERGSDCARIIRRMKKSCASAQLTPLALDHPPPPLSETHTATTSTCVRFLNMKEALTICSTAKQE